MTRPLRFALQFKESLKAFLGSQYVKIKCANMNGTGSVLVEKAYDVPPTAFFKVQIHSLWLYLGN